MKHLLFISFLLLPNFCTGQAIDTVAIKANIDTLFKRANESLLKNDLEKALEIQIEVPDLTSGLYGKESEYYAKMSSDMAKILLHQERYEEAVKWALNAKNITERVLGKEHLN